MFVLGIDPGLTRCGYGLIERSAKRPRCVTAGLLTTSPDDALPLRLATLSVDLEELIAELKPDVVVVEHVFFQTNVRTAIPVAQAAGLALAAGHRSGAEVVQYTANEVKSSVTGDGAAAKAQTQTMVKHLLGLEVEPNPPDVADALALALCFIARAGLHSQMNNLQSKITGGSRNLNNKQTTKTQKAPA